MIGAAWILAFRTLIRDSFAGSFSLKVIASAILLAVLGAHSAAAADDSTDTSYLLTNVELSAAEPMNTSAQDLMIFGVISLGVIGLFWIRRHTSEL